MTAFEVSDPIACCVALIQEGGQYEALFEEFVQMARSHDGSGPEFLPARSVISGPEPEMTARWDELARGRPAVSIAQDSLTAHQRRIPQSPLKKRTLPSVVLGNNLESCGSIGKVAEMFGPMYRKSDYMGLVESFAKEQNMRIDYIDYDILFYALTWSPSLTVECRLNVECRWSTLTHPIWMLVSRDRGCEWPLYEGLEFAVAADDAHPDAIREVLSDARRACEVLSELVCPNGTLGIHQAEGLLKSEDPLVRYVAVSALLHDHTVTDVVKYADNLAHPDAVMRAYVLQMFQKTQTPIPSRYMAALIEDPNSIVRATIQESGL